MELKSNYKERERDMVFKFCFFFFSVKKGMYLNTMDYLSAVDETFKNLLKQ
jgi:hypothetical protein